MKKNNNTSGAVILLYVIVITVLILLMIFGSQSASILNVRRNQSSVDQLTAMYTSESVANDYMARIVGEFIKANEFPFEEEFEKDGHDVTVKGYYDDQDQIILVTSKKKFAVGTVEARRRNFLLGKYDHVDIILSLDCTESMNAGASCKNCFKPPTRFNTQEEAAVNFIDDLIELGPGSQKYSLGVQVFGGDTKWLKSLNGTDITPSSGVPLVQIKEAITTQFGDTRNQSPACSGVMDFTSLGSPLSVGHDYFATMKRSGLRQIEIIISDGLPNSRSPENSSCPDNVFCPSFPLSSDGTINYCETNEHGWECYRGDEYVDGPYGKNNYNNRAYKLCEPLGIDYVACSIANTDTEVDEIGGLMGSKDPDVSTYLVIVYHKLEKKYNNLFKKYIPQENYFNASQADQLSGILNIIFEQITQDKSIISTKRVVVDD